MKIKRNILSKFYKCDNNFVCYPLHAETMKSVEEKFGKEEIAWYLEKYSDKYISHFRIVTSTDVITIDVETLTKKTQIHHQK